MLHALRANAAAERLLVRVASQLPGRGGSGTDTFTSALAGQTANACYHIGMKQYEWKRVSHNPERYQLLDVVSHKPIAFVEQTAEGRWNWIRNTTVRLQRAPFGEGVSDSLEDAQAAVVVALPSDC